MLDENLAALSKDMPGASRTVAWGRGRQAVEVASLGSGKLVSTRLPAGTNAVGAIWPIPHVIDGFTAYHGRSAASNEGLVLEAHDGRGWVPVRQDLRAEADAASRCTRFTFEPIATRQMRVRWPAGRPLPVVRIEIHRYSPELVNGRLTWPRRMITHELTEDFLARPEEPGFEAIAMHGLSMPTWAMMGLKDLGQEQAVHWDGEIYTRPCRLAMALGRGRAKLPAVRDTIRRRLIDGYLPGVIVEAQIGDIAIRQTSFTVFVDDTHDLAAVYVRYELRNVGKKAFRGPLEIEAKSPTVLLMKDPPPPIPLRLAFEAGALQEDGTVFLVGLGRCRKSARPNAMAFDLNIAPGATAVVDLAAPQTNPTSASGAALRRTGFDEARRRFLAYWKRILSPLARVHLPEPRLNDLYRAIVTQIFINAHGNLMPYGAMPGGYELDFYGIEEGYAMMGLAFFGFIPDAQRYMEDTYLTRAFLTKVEKYRSWPDRHQQYRNGLQPTYAVDAFRFSRDRAWMRKHVNLLRDCAEWTITNRRKTMVLKGGTRPLTWGLLPKWTFGGDIADQKCHSLFANFTCWRGLKDTAWVMGQLGDAKAAGRYAREASDYRRCVLRAVDGIYRAKGRPPMLPLAVERGATTGGEYYQLFAGILLDQLPFEFDDKRASYLGDFLEQDNRTFLGLARFRVEQATVDAPHTAPGMLDAIYSMGHLLTRLHQGRVREFLLGFYAYQVFNLEHHCFGSRESNPIYASDPHLRTLYRTSEVTDPLPCSSAVALHLLRHMLVTEESRGGGTYTGALQLLWGAPRAWFSQGKRIAVENAPTHFGPVSFDVRSDVRRGVIRATVTAPSRQPCTAIHLRLRHPDGLAIKRVTLNGVPHKRFDAAKELITILKPSGTVKVEAYFWRQQSGTSSGNEIRRFDLHGEALCLRKGIWPGARRRHQHRAGPGCQAHPAPVGLRAAVHERPLEA